MIRVLIPKGPDVPQEILAVTQLGERYDDPARTAISQLLQDPSAKRWTDIVERIVAEHEAAPRLSPVASGALAFYLFVWAAEAEAAAEAETGAAVTPLAHGAFPRANRHLARPDVQDFIGWYYMLPAEYRVCPLYLHRRGTTSYILRLSRPGTTPLALKLIKPWNLTNVRIRKETKEYQSRFEGFHGDHVPDVKATGEGWILMAFIEGETLRAHMADRFARLSSPLEKVGVVRALFRDLCGILRGYAAHGILHQDLSPDNVLISTYFADGEHPRVWLIDFGSNYLLAERVGTARDVQRALSYMAKEMLHHPDDPTIVADVYSLAVITLELLSEALLGRRAPREFNLQVCLERLWRDYPPLAEVLSSALGPAGSRLVDAPRDHTIYDVFLRRVDAELMTFAEVYLRKGALDRALTVAECFFPSGETIRRGVSELAFRRDHNLGDAREMSRLLRWAIVCSACHLITTTAFLYFFFEDLKTGAWPATYPGRFVAVSFSFVAVQYYLNVFSRLSTRPAWAHPNRIVRWAERSMRVMAVSPFPFIWFALFVRPSAWAWCSGLGALFVIANNYLAYRAACAGREDLVDRVDELVLRDLDDALTAFQSWWPNMGVYGLALLTVAALLQLGILHDAWMYAMMTVVINLSMFYYTCTRQAPGIRAAAQRLLAGLRPRRQ